MNQYVVTGFITLLFSLLVTFSIDLSVGSVTHTDNHDALDRSAKSAISQSVNLGTLRVDEEIEIDPEVAKVEFKKAYENSASFKDSDSIRKYNVEVVNAKPAMLAVKSEVKAASHFFNFTNQKEKSIDSQVKNIVIYEAKSEKKMPGGNSSETR